MPAAPEQGREFTLQCLGLPFPAPPARAVKPVWAHSPLSQPGKEFVPGKRRPALSLRHQEGDSCEHRGGDEEQESGKGQRASARSRELGTCLGIPSGGQEWLWSEPAAGVTLAHLLWC